MTEPQPVEIRQTYSINRLAAEFSMGRDTIKKRLSEAGTRPAKTEAGHPVFFLRDAVPALFEFGSGDGTGMRPQDELALERAAESRVDRALKERKLQELEKQLVRVDEARLEMADMAKSVIQLLDILPDVLERDCGLPAAAVIRCQEVIERERAQLAERLST